MALVPAIGSPSTDEVAQLKADLEELKAQYEARIRELEDRLPRLEGSPDLFSAETPEGQAVQVASGPPQAEQAAGTPSPARLDRRRNYFANRTESRSQALQYKDSLFRERVSQIISEYGEIQGYFRAGGNPAGNLFAQLAPGRQAVFLKA